MTESQFYKKGAEYWENIPATVNGVLGGFGHISNTDVEGSKAFLKEILSSDNPPGTKLVLDVGAGIGRVSKYVLIPQFDKVDLVEQNEKFINTARTFIGEDFKSKIGELYNTSLQSFKPSKMYDLIWCQWVLGHLKDYDLVDFFERCRVSLNNNGVIVVKENIAAGTEIEYDEVDSFVTRPCELMKQIFNEAKLKIIKTEVQNGFPTDIYPVHSFALIPMEE